MQYSSVVQDWHIICAAWKWLGEDEVKSISIKPHERFPVNGVNDINVIKKLHGLISSADAIVAHNGDSFDWKRFMARVIFHKLPPVKKPVMIDTLKQARKFGFTSKKLDDLAAQLGLSRKIENEKGLFLRASYGESKAIKALEKYCTADIPPLEELYSILRPYSETSFNMGHYHNGVVCPKCGSEHIRANGHRRNVTGLVQMYKCKECYGYFQKTKRDRSLSVK